MRRRRLVKTLLFAALAVGYGGVALGMWLGNDTRDIIQHYRSAIPRSDGTIVRGDTPRTDDFWAQQGQFSSAVPANTSDWTR